MPLSFNCPLCYRTTLRQTISSWSLADWLNVLHILNQAEVIWALCRDINIMIGVIRRECVTDRPALPVSLIKVLMKPVAKNKVFRYIINGTASFRPTKGYVTYFFWARCNFLDRDQFFSQLRNNNSLKECLCKHWSHDQHNNTSECQPGQLFGKETSSFHSNVLWYLWRG